MDSVRSDEIICRMTAAGTFARRSDSAATPEQSFC